MKRRIVSVDLANLKDLPPRCRSCLYWESPEKVSPGRRTKSGLIGKEAWFSNTLLSWGECGKMLYQNGNILAYAQYAPPEYFPKSYCFEAGAASADAVFLPCLYVMSEVRGRGLGKLLLQAIEKDLFRQNYKAIETIADKKHRKDNPPGPIDFFHANGFYIARDNRRYPLMRLDLKSIVTWQDNLEAILNSLTLPGFRPVRVETPIPT